MIYLYPIVLLGGIFIFTKQERRHKFERSLFLTYEQILQRKSFVRRDKAESILVLFLGLTLVEMGIAFLLPFIEIMKDDHARRIISDSITSQTVLIGVLLGGGFGVLLLGIRSLIENFR